MKKIFGILFITIILASCHSSENEFKLEYEAEEGIEVNVAETSYSRKREVHEDSESSVSNQSQEQTPTIDKKKIIKDGNMQVVVTNLQQTKSKIDDLLKKYKAYYSNEQFRDDDYNSNFYLTIRIPNKNFENLIKEIESGEGKITQKSITARDVTDQFIDLKSRLINKKQYLNQYRELLKKAIKIKEILEIQEKIRRLEEEIDSTEGRLKYLGDQVNYSTLTLTVTMKKEFEYTPEEKDSFIERIKQATSNGWNGFVDFIIVLFKVWPLWIIIIGLYFVWRKFRRKRRIRRERK